MCLGLGLSGIFPILDWGYAALARILQKWWVLLFSVHHIMEFMMSTCFITGRVDLRHLVKTFSAGFLRLTVTVFSLVVNRYLGGNILRLYKSWFSSNLRTLILAHIRGSQFCNNCYYGICLLVILYFSLSFNIF